MKRLLVLCLFFGGCNAPTAPDVSPEFASATIPCIAVTDDGSVNPCPARQMGHVLIHPATTITVTVPRAGAR